MKIFVEYLNKQDEPEDVKTVFEHWNNNDQGFTNFGSFQTTIFQAYRLADQGNRERLEKAFPYWFTTKYELL